MSKSLRIALIHATPVALEPIRLAFEAAWPDVELVNILDDSLSPDRARSPEISEALVDRIHVLARYGASVGSGAVLFTCSAFGSAIDGAAANTAVPVLKPNEAMFEAAIDRGGRIAMLYTFEPARDGMEEEFRDEVEKRGSDANLTSVYVPDAIDALRAGDAATHNQLVSDKAKRLSGFSSIMLAHFSMARALVDVRAATAIPVLSSPEQAVAKLRRLIG